MKLLLMQFSPPSVYFLQVFPADLYCQTLPILKRAAILAVM
jgi:hypothetical protein